MIHSNPEMHVQLVSQLRSGDEKSFGELYDAYSSMLYGIILRIVDDRLETMKAPMMAIDVAEFEGVVAALRAQLDNKTLEKFWTKGKSMTPEGAIAFALEEKWLPFVDDIRTALFENAGKILGMIPGLRCAGLISNVNR